MKGRIRVYGEGWDKEGKDKSSEKVGIKKERIKVGRKLELRRKG